MTRHLVDRALLVMAHEALSDAFDAKKRVVARDLLASALQSEPHECACVVCAVRAGNYTKKEEKVARVLEDVPRVEKRCTCPNCGQTIAYTNADVKRYEGRDYSGGPDGQESIACPGCGKPIILRAW